MGVCVGLGMRMNAEALLRGQYKPFRHSARIVLRHRSRPACACTTSLYGWLVKCLAVGARMDSLLWFVCCFQYLLATIKCTVVDVSNMARDVHRGVSMHVHVHAQCMHNLTYLGRAAHSVWRF
jgi:hypothetical protein